MASMDTAREWMVKWGHHDYRRTALRVAQLREQFPSLREKKLSLDPTRFVLSVQNGPAFTRALEKRGVYPEMEDGGHVVFICTPFDNSFSLSALERRLEELREQMGPCPPIPAPPLPEQAMSPRRLSFPPAGSGRWGTVRGGGRLSDRALPSGSTSSGSRRGNLKKIAGLFETNRI